MEFGKREGGGEARNWSRVGMVAGGLLGGVSGVALGAVVGPLGVALGLLIGAVAGFLAAKVTEKEDRRRADRTRHLDAVIGMTQGSLGAAPVSVPPAEWEPLSDPDAWLAEWLTPPPPVAG